MNESDIIKTVSKQNFFALITSFYGKHMMCQCKQNTDGVLLYWTGTDLGITLSNTKVIRQFRNDFVKAES